MPTIKFTLADGTLREVPAEVGRSVMQTAVTHDVPGIVGECGGNAMCATCHVYVDPRAGGYPPISDLEDEMLDCTVCPRENNSRLSCQLYVNEEDAEPLSVSIPERQL